MITSKVLALSLLLCSPFALARVQLNSVIEVGRPVLECARTLETEVQFDADETVVICDSDNLRIEMKITIETEEMVEVQYSVYVENKSGDYELIAAPTLSTTYDRPARILLGHRASNGTKVETLKITMNAIKA